MAETRRVVVVTGGSRGIGRAICLELAGEGVDVWFNHYDPDDEAAGQTQEMVEAKGATCRWKRFSVADPAEVKAFFDEIVETSGRVDVLVNNAGITMDGLLVRMRPEQFMKVIEVNLLGTFLCLQAAARIMMSQRSGAIVNIASVVGLMGNAGQANYAASKAGVIGLTKTAARELAPRGVRVNAVAPGFIETEMTAAIPQKLAEAMKAMIPLGRAGQPEDVARVVAFLASDKAAYVTGQVVGVCGGMYM